MEKKLCRKCQKPLIVPSWVLCQECTSVYKIKVESPKPVIEKFKPKKDFYGHMFYEGKFIRVDHIAIPLKNFLKAEVILIDEEYNSVIGWQ